MLLECDNFSITQNEFELKIQELNFANYHLDSKIKFLEKDIDDKQNVIQLIQENKLSVKDMDT